MAVSQPMGGSRRKARTVSSGMQTVTEMNFDGWWEVDPILESRAMVFRTYRQTKPFFAAWVGVVAQVGRSRNIMKKFLQQLRNDVVALFFSKWSAFAEDHKKNKQKEDIVYKRFQCFSQLQCLKLWQQEAASQVRVRKQTRAIGFRLMNAGVNVCFLTWAANVYIISKQRSITKRFVALMTKGAMEEGFVAWSALTVHNVEARKTESIMRKPPFWKAPRSQYTYNVTLRLMSSQPVGLVARLYGTSTSSDDLQSPASGGQAQVQFSVHSFTHLGIPLRHANRLCNTRLGKLHQFMLWLPDDFKGKVYLDSVEVIDTLNGLGYSFSFETWIDSEANKRSTAHSNSDGKHVQPPQDLPVIVKHEIRGATRGDLERREAALRRFLCGAASLPGDAFEIMHSAYSLDGLAADIFTKAFPYRLKNHQEQLPVIAAATSRCFRMRAHSRALVARDTLVKFVSSAVVRALNRQIVGSTALVWGMMQRAALQAQYSIMIGASMRICGYLRKKIVFWEVARRWRATDIVVRKFRRRQRWMAWKKFVRAMNQIRVLLQRLLPYTRLVSLKQSAAHLKWSVLLSLLSNLNQKSSRRK